MIKQFVKFVSDAIHDPERELSERVFVIFSIISEIAVLIALVGDIVFQENIGEIITLIGIVIAVPLVTFVCLYKNVIRFAIVFLVTSLIFLILPALFFFGGGLEGGGYIWFVFAFMYIGLVITGKSRKRMIGLLILMMLICYAIAWFYPELVAEHSRAMYFADSFISVVLVGILCFYMTWSQNMLFMEENARAKKETERAEELTRSQNRFFSSMSHEIRTPINSILGLNELILRDPEATDEIVRDATGIAGSGKMLLALINDILDFSKMEAGSMDIVPVDYRVGDLLSEIVNMIWLKAQEKGLEFNVSVDPEVPSVLYGDEVRIKQIIINLLNNAVKYTAEGSVSLHIEHKDADSKTTTLMISISDTGMGIKKEALPYLFDAFRRVDEAKNRHIEGTGLGLSIVRELTELMNGTVTVNSVYGEGSTFTVTLKQGITDEKQIGDLNIQNKEMMKRSKYESGFKAPDAKILIVDDNEMNLEVEKKLLKDTQIVIDTVVNGREALEKTLQNRYDVILMDHLMPEMDGIDCLKAIRSQTGGMNRTSPVIVLTANAGSDNRELYHREGFDGYLLKPVSGEMLEDILMRHISRDKLIISEKQMRMHEDIKTAAGYARKAPVVITSTSMCDLPDEVLRRLNIPILPFIIRTDEGVFKDGVQMDANELIRYINAGGTAVSSPPDVSAYTEFFSAALKKAHQLIHIALTTSMSKDYRNAMEAARAFDNVIVVNSECLSSATGILVLIAQKLAQQNVPVPEIVAELEAVKKRLRCGFVMGSTAYMAERGLISQRMHRIAKSLNLYPSLSMRDDKSRLSGMWLGERKRVYRKYIHNAFPVDIIPDSDVVFITYADVPLEVLQWVKEEISRIAYFEHVIFKQASAAISSNCGPGTLGILYFVKSNKSYNIGSFFPEEEETETEEEVANLLEFKTENGERAEEEEQPWYQKFDFIDGETAVKNSGSETVFRSVLNIFYDSIPDKTAELNGYYEAEDWENYTIKIHALKSSAKLIGAMKFSEEAQLLEDAGKAQETGYIKEHFPTFMQEYEYLRNRLKEYFGETESKEEEREKPEADEFLMESVYEGLKDAAEEMDCDAIEGILEEMEPYRIPEAEQDKYNAIVKAAGNYDYDAILALLGAGEE